MKLSKIIVLVSTFIPLFLICISAFLPINYLWGINHIGFLNFNWAIIAICVTIILLVLYLTKLFSKIINSIFSAISVLIFEKGKLPGILLALTAGVCFYLFRQKLFFIGDGYHLLNAFGGLSQYTTGFSKFGTILIVRLTQSLLFGGYTYETALATFRIISFISGIFFVFTIWMMSTNLTENRQVRFLSFCVLIFSGMLLIFMGHVEFYSLVLFFSALFILSAILYLKKRLPFAVTVLLFIGSMFIHLETIALFPGFVFLIFHRFYYKRVNNMDNSKLLLIFGGTILMSVIAAAVFPLLFPLSGTFFLPFMKSDSTISNYGIISSENLLEIINLILLVSPSIFSLLAISLRGKLNVSLQSKFLIILSSGCLSFLLVIQPALGMGRDFDLMTLMILPVTLSLLSIISDKNEKLPGCTVLTIISVCLISSLSFCVASVKVPITEKRVESLLNLYGNKDRGGWVSYAGYVKKCKPSYEHRRILKTMDKLFPSYASLREINSLIILNKLDEAKQLTDEFLKIEPENGRLLRVMGKVLTRQGEYQKALEYYQNAVIHNPNYLSYEKLGFLHLRMGNYLKANQALRKAHEAVPQNLKVMESLASSFLFLDQNEKAVLIADTLFQLQKDSPGGHIIMLIASIKRDEIALARQHYKAFLLTGSSRADYEKISNSYEFLIK